ncbi:MAG: hypothetical protein ACP5N2_03610 [Candidatus Nanoarchaeia archaeon]
MNSNNVLEGGFELNELFHELYAYSVNYVFAQYNLPEKYEGETSTKEHNSICNLSDVKLFFDEYQIPLKTQNMIIRSKSGMALLKGKNEVIYEARLRSISKKLRYDTHFHNTLEQIIMQEPQNNKSNFAKYDYIFFNKHAYSKIKQLIMSSDLSLIMTKIKADPNLLIREINLRISEIKDEFTIEEKLRLPVKVPKSTKFQPLKIKWKPRNFQGDPLLFFRKNRDIYGGLSRQQLKKLDPSLHRALLYYGKISEAIPSFNQTSLTPNKIKLIDKVLIENKGNITETMKQLHADFYTVKSRAIRNKIPSYISKKYINYHLSNSEINRIKRAHAIYDGNISMTQKNLGHCKKTISDVWRAYGYEINQIRKMPADIKSINEFHALNNSYKKTAELLRFDEETVAKYRKKSLKIGSIMYSLLNAHNNQEST